MGVRKCIDVSSENTYAEDQIYDCLRSYPFDENGKSAVSVVYIRCVASPEFQRRAVIYQDPQ